jgi:hypothetical protein
MEQSEARVLKNVGIPRIFGGILALTAEAVLLAMPMATAGICALGSIIGWIGRKGESY